jgi:hypothetical protein
MKLSPALVEYISARVVHALVKEEFVQAADVRKATAAVEAAFTDDLQVEDRLNDEVRELLRAHSDKLAQDVQYHEAFKMIKARLVRDRKIIL